MEKTISIVIPAMNEEEGIGATLDELPLRELKERGFTSEVLVVDGCSKDETVSIARSKGARVVVEPRKGYGRAYKTGFEEARGDCIATLDADGTYPAHLIPGLVDQLLSDHLDFITTNRLARLEVGAMSRSHVIGNKILTLACRLLFNVNIKDSQSGMWIFRRSILARFDVKSDGMGFSQEFKIKSFQNCTAREVPIYYRPRVGEVKLSTFNDGYKNLKELWNLYRAPETGSTLLQLPTVTKITSPTESHVGMIQEISLGSR